jgi:hypothetical protein
MDKSIKLGEEVRVLFNRAESKYLSENPTVKKLTDELVIKKALEVYLK